LSWPLSPVSCQMVIVSRSCSCSHSFISNGVRGAFDFNGKMCGIKAIFLVWIEFCKFINFLSRWFYVFEANRSKSVDRFIKIQSARTSIFIAEAVHVILAIRLVIFASRYFYNDRISYWASICVNNFEIKITHMIFRHSTCST